MIFIGVWITAVFQAALHNLETYWVSSLPCVPFSVGLVHMQFKRLHTEFNILNNVIENEKRS